MIGKYYYKFCWVLCLGALFFASVIPAAATPDWVEDAVIYHIFVDRFRDGNPQNNDRVKPHLSHEQRLKDWWGGDLEGVIESLDYLEALGINTIWISPVFKGTEYHGYHITDYQDIDAHFGGREVFQEFLVEAEQRGMGIILDMVPNHSARAHPFFQEALREGEASPYYDFYNFRNWPHTYATFYGVQELPKLDLTHKEAREYMIDEYFLYWLKEGNPAGYRMDYAKGPDMLFWEELYHALSPAEDLFLFGEIWDGYHVIFQYRDVFHGALDFPAAHALREYVAVGRGGVGQLHIGLQEAREQDEFRLVSFLDNHDMPRFLWLAQGDTRRLKVGAVLQFTHPGPPILYYGTEVGLSQSADHTPFLTHQDRFFREPMVWEEEEWDRDLLSFYQDLIAIRKEYAPIIVNGSYHELHVSSFGGLYAYGWSHGGESLAVIVNIRDREEELNVDLEALFPGAQKVVELFSGADWDLEEGRLQGTLAGLTALVFGLE